MILGVPFDGEIRLEFLPAMKKEGFFCDQPVDVMGYPSGNGALMVV